MNVRYSVLFLLTLGGALQAGYKIGHYAGKHAAWTESRHWAAYETARRTDEQVRRFRVVQAKREQSQYRKGREECYK